ncbi:hypothetical protein CLOM_g11850, partial [Closterium sp. NIES-68]
LSLLLARPRAVNHLWREQSGGRPLQIGQYQTACGRRSPRGLLRAAGATQTAPLDPALAPAPAESRGSEMTGGEAMYDDGACMHSTVALRQQGTWAAAYMHNVRLVNPRQHVPAYIISLPGYTSHAGAN